MRLRDANFAVIDVETTGIDPQVDRVVEVACAIVRDGRQIDVFSSLVNPQRTIPEFASAVHHITDRDVRNAPVLRALEPQLRAMCADAVVVAHNARFDLGFLPFLKHRPVLCSLRFAMRMVPDAPNHRNQGLRRYLQLDDAQLAHAVPHRALGDVLVTSGILNACIDRYIGRGSPDDVEFMVREIAAPRELPALPFGRYRGLAIAAVPVDYLQWVHSESRSASTDSRYTARRELERRRIGGQSPVDAGAR